MASYMFLSFPLYTEYQLILCEQVVLPKTKRHFADEKINTMNKKVYRSYLSGDFMIQLSLTYSHDDADSIK